MVSRILFVGAQVEQEEFRLIDLETEEDVVRSRVCLVPPSMLPRTLLLRPASVHVFFIISWNTFVQVAHYQEERDHVW